MRTWFHLNTLFLLLLFGATPRAEAQVDPQLAQRYFEEATKLCERDAGRLWGVSLCGPMVILTQRPEREPRTVSRAAHNGGTCRGRYPEIRHHDSRRHRDGAAVVVSIWSFIESSREKMHDRMVIAAMVLPPQAVEATLRPGAPVTCPCHHRCVWFAVARASFPIKNEVSMRCLVTGMLMLAAAGCTSPDAGTRKAEETVVPTAVAFDGADYRSDAAKTAHGKRLVTLFQCSGCHGAEYSGSDFGAGFPIVKGLWASNISLVMPAMSDAVLERLLREGVHPDREIYVMPSKQLQFLSERDMAALIAFLRTIPAVGKPTPLPPAGFEAAVTARLPDDYWLTLKEGERRGYHNAAEEVAYFAANQPPDLGPQSARGRMIASSLCSGCHGAALDGLGEPAGDIQGALAYDDAAFDRLLIESIDRTGKRVTVEWGFGHEAQPLSAAERRDVIAYVRALARRRER